VYGLEAAGPAAAEAETVLRLADGRPWAVAGGTPDGGRYVLLASPLTPEAGSVPTSAAMVPLLDRATTAWAVRRPDRPQRSPGDAVAVAGDSVTGPAGTVAVTPGSLFRFREPGIYRVVGGDGVAYAVNPPAAESDLTRLPVEEVVAQVGGADVRVADADGWSGSIYHRRLGREVTLWLVAAALALLALESVLASSGPRAAGRAG
jgi:hypothetical protein